MAGRIAAIVIAMLPALTLATPTFAQDVISSLHTLIDGKAPGTLIEAQPLAGAPDGASAYRVLYWSTGLHEEPIVVSGMVIVPAGAAPAGGRSVVAWAHPTTGVVPRCAPSLARTRFQSIQGLRDMIARGYAVAATDYPGLGTPETHPYLVGESEARAVLDSVRAAHMIQGVGADERFAVWGHSQGGQAALFTGRLAKSYAPDLKLVGVAAAAPATELEALLEADLDTTGGKNLTAMTLWSWARVYNAPIDAVLDPAAIPTVDRLAGECIESIYDILLRSRTERPLERRFLRVKHFAEAEPWRSLLLQNTPGTMPADVPVFISQGSADKLVRPSITQDYVRTLCRGGSDVSFNVWPGVNHGFIGRKSAAQAVAWISDRFAGQEAPSTCHTGRN